MKNIFLLFISLILFGHAFSQNGLKPSFKNQPMLIEGESLSKLEKQLAENKVKVKAMGYGGAQQEISIPGDKSPVRISNLNPEFLIWVEEGLDPETIIVLSETVTQKKGLRNVPISKTSAFAGMGARGKSMTGKYGVAIEVEEYATGVFKIIISEKLESGKEYVFYNPGDTEAKQLTLFAFGVD